ncbi:GL26589 [Drosophila persimilis]|uniref:GL26589 n=1 Tax=Drosophila persimilis TaxID=7234 RepID=B4GSR9_DROPE|nr:GL26589 [Drosophila persimilis]
MNLTYVLLALGLFLLEEAAAVCCPALPICGDGQMVVGAYCGVGGCNVFGCNCSGGCRKKSD